MTKEFSGQYNTNPLNFIEERLKSLLKECAPFRGTRPWNACARKQDNERKGANNGGVKASTNSDIDTNLWARSKTRLQTRGYKGSEVLVSLSRQSCDHSLRFWPGQMRGHYPSGNHYLLSVFSQTSIGYLQALGTELSYSHCTQLSCLYLAVEIYCN